ncbi:MAG: hypothetical protein K9J80_09695 [Sulfuritalea sp.]|nr:hypothetical protein [Sulfuritalea sp.]
MPIANETHAAPGLASSVDTKNPEFPGIIQIDILGKKVLSVLERRSASARNVAFPKRAHSTSSERARFISLCRQANV